MFISFYPQNSTTNPYRQLLHPISQNPKSQFTVSLQDSIKSYLAATELVTVKHHDGLDKNAQHVTLFLFYLLTTLKYFY